MTEKESDEYADRLGIVLMTTFVICLTACMAGGTYAFLRWCVS